MKLSHYLLTTCTSGCLGMLLRVLVYLCPHTSGGQKAASSVASSEAPFPLLCETDYLTGTHGSWMRLGWKDNEPWASTAGSLELPNAGITSICYHRLMFLKIWVHGIEVRSSSLCRKHLGSCAIIRVLPLTLLIRAFYRNITHRTNIY